MKFKRFFVLPLLFSLGLFSCKKEEAEIESMSAYPFTGDWTVTYKVETSPGVLEDLYGLGQTELLVYNTDANDGRQVWIDDRENFWIYKVKSTVNMGDLTFKAQQAVNAAMVENEYDQAEPYDIKVNVVNGKVIRNGTRLKGQPADSIYFQISFEDDLDANNQPFATVYHVSGHRSAL